jgi:uncharacterized protein YhfF
MGWQGEKMSTLDRLAFSDSLVPLVLAGRKTQTRRTNTRKWSKLRMGEPLIMTENFYRLQDGGMWPSCAGLPPVPYTRKLSARFMRKTDSRCTLEAAADRRFQRLLDISEDDAQAEGFGTRTGFLEYWNMLHGAGAAGKDPLVVVIEFRVLAVHG